jgi:hypothetical protein
MARSLPGSFQNPGRISQLARRVLYLTQIGRGGALSVSLSACVTFEGSTGEETTTSTSQESPTDTKPAPTSTTAAKLPASAECTDPAGDTDGPPQADLLAVSVAIADEDLDVTWTVADDRPSGGVPGTVYTVSLYTAEGSADIGVKDIGEEPIVYVFTMPDAQNEYAGTATMDGDQVHAAIPLSALPESAESWSATAEYSADNGFSSDDCQGSGGLSLR